MENCWFYPPFPCLTPPSGGTPWDINAIYTRLKSICNGLQLRRWHCRSIFIRLAVVASQNRKITRKSDKIWTYSSSRSSKVIDHGVNGKPICDFLLIINCNFSRICYHFRDIHKIFLPHPFEAPARRNPLEYLAETYLQKLEGLVIVWWKFRNPYFNRFSMIHPSDRQTDGRTDRRTGDSIYAL